MILSVSINRAESQLALERILHSRVFGRARRSRRFLCYLVDSALAEPPIAVKEYTIAADVFDRAATYDPAVHATVRVEAGRLRQRLREYYDEEGSTDPILIQVPKGAYAAVFSKRPEILTRRPATFSNAPDGRALDLASVPPTSGRRTEPALRRYLHQAAINFARLGRILRERRPS